MVLRILILLLAVVPATLLSPDSSAAVEFRFRKGVNLEVWQTWTSRGGFLAPTYDRSNFPDWQASVSDQQLSKLRGEGFDFVRLNVDPSPFFWVGEEGEGPLLDGVLRAVKRLQQAGFAVIVDLHLLPGMDDRPAGIHDVLGTGGRQETLFGPYKALVQRVATLLSPLPTDKTALELINEPDQDWFSFNLATDRWPGQLRALYATAREAAPKLTLVLSGGRSGSIDGLLRLDPAPYAQDPNVIWTFHYYEPMAVTHAGQPWEETPGRFLTRLPFPASKIDDRSADALLTSARRAVEQTIKDPKRREELKRDVGAALQRYRASKASPATIAADVKRVSAWSAANNVSPDRILLGEFGVFQDQADPDARVAVIRATRLAAEKAGFGWAIYTAGLSKAHNSYGIMGDVSTLSVEPAIRDALALTGQP